jgi:Aldehyde oxidase and xanthine dehydrogenase, a/b hammerhead domain
MSGGIGQSVARLDGPGKVSGRARYAADTPLNDVTYAVIVPATRPHARIAALDLAAALAAPGVIHIFTHENTPKFGPVTVLLSQPVLPLQDDRVLYEGQPVALVVADGLERATEAARLVRSRIATSCSRSTSTPTWTARKSRGSSSAFRSTGARATSPRPGPTPMCGSRPPTAPPTGITTPWNPAPRWRSGETANCSSTTQRRA